MTKLRAAVAAAALLAGPSAAANCPLHTAACTAPDQQRFLRLWAQKVRCWLCDNITAELAGTAVKLLKQAISLDLGVTSNWHITRAWLETCLPAYVLSMLASTRASSLQPYRLYEFGLNILWNCRYDPLPFYRTFGVTPDQISYVFGLIGRRGDFGQQLLSIQGPEREAATATTALVGEASLAVQPRRGHRPWNAPLIVDVGMGIGADARYYLRQGFRVVAVEANPLAVDAVLADPHMAPFLESSQFSVLNAAIASPNSTEPRASFFVYETRPEQSNSAEWVALHGAKEVSVRTIQCADLLRVYGQAIYMKVDVESNTIDCLESLHREAELSRGAGIPWSPPRLISLEVEAAHIVEIIHDRLLRLGYATYKVCRQFLYSPAVCEGSAYDAEVPGCGSGPFGEAAVDYRGGVAWRSLHELPNDTGFVEEFSSGLDWFDLHAKLPD